MTDKEAMAMALDALENSVDLVVEDAYNAEQLYGNYPTRQGKVGGLKILADQHKEAIAALKERLAQEKALQALHNENERLGLYEDAYAQPEQEPVAWGVFEGNLHDMFFTQEEAQEMASLKGSHAEVRPLYTTPPQRTEQEPTPEIKYKMIVIDDLHPQGIPVEQWVNPPQRTEPLIGCVNHDCAKCKERNT